MSAELEKTIELPELPNNKLKIQRANIQFAPDFLHFPLFPILINPALNNVGSEGIDILIILFYLYYKCKEKDGLLYTNTDDILILRSIKQNKAGYKKEVRKRIDEKIRHLEKTGFYTVVDYKKFNYIIDFDKNIFNNTEKIISVDKKLLALNPNKKSWHKIIGLYITILKHNSKSNTSTIQVKKLLNLISKILPHKTLFPFQIRQRFEDALDDLNAADLFKGWHYKNIDEDVMNSKNWLFFWKLLSIKIIF